MKCFAVYKNKPDLLLETIGKPFSSSNPSPDILIDLEVSSFGQIMFLSREKDLLCPMMTEELTQAGSLTPKGTD